MVFTGCAAELEDKCELWKCILPVLLSVPPYNYANKNLSSNLIAFVASGILIPSWRLYTNLLVLSGHMVALYLLPCVAMWNKSKVAGIVSRRKHLIAIVRYSRFLFFMLQ